MKDAFILKTLFHGYDEKLSQEYSEIGDAFILSVFIFLLCVVGLLGNGNVIWLLGFCIKRKPFAVYILNLAVADFVSLVSLLLLNINYPSLIFDISLLPPIVDYLLLSFSISMYGSSQLFLAAISMDRWVFVLFPNWYQCHRLLVSSTTMCALIWAISLVLGGVPLMQLLTLFTPGAAAFTMALEYIASTLISVFIVIISALTLLIKGCLRSQQGQQKNLSKVVLPMLLSFLLFTLLGNVGLFMVSIRISYVGLWASLMSSRNPLIYFLAGRQNRGTFQERMKAIFQRVFKEERHTWVEREPHTQTML